MLRYLGFKHFMSDRIESVVLLIKKTETLHLWYHAQNTSECLSLQPLVR